MKDFWVDANYKFNLSNRDFQFSPDDVNYVIQKLRIKLRTFYGEYFFNTGIGIPYFQTIFKKNPNMDTISAIFKAQILGEPLVDSLTSFLMEYDNESRVLSTAFTALLVSGAVVDTTILAP